MQCLHKCDEQELWIPFQKTQSTEGKGVLHICSLWYHICSISSRVFTSQGSPIVLNSALSRNFLPPVKISFQSLLSTKASFCCHYQHTTSAWTRQNKPTASSDKYLSREKNSQEGRLYWGRKSLCAVWIAIIASQEIANCNPSQFQSQIFCMPFSAWAGTPTTSPWLSYSQEPDGTWESSLSSSTRRRAFL